MAPPLVVLAVYAFWLASYFAAHHDIWNFVLIGRHFSPHNPHAHAGTGYDGQWYYYIATDLFRAGAHLDHPGYRFLRIVYPLAAGALSLGHASLVPYTLLLVNVCAVLGGTFAVAWWLQRRSISRWWALVYGLFPGLLTATARDVADPLAFGFVAVGATLLDRRVWWAAVCLGLAALTRESTVVFPLVLGLFVPARHASISRRLRAICGFWSISVAPLMLYKLALVVWLHSSGVPADAHPALVPLEGILSWWPWRMERVEAVICIVLPALVCLGMCLRAFRARQFSAPVILLAVNVMLFVVMLNHDSYSDVYGSFRVAIGVLLSALYCLPYFDLFSRRHWLWLCSGCWLALAPGFFVFGPIAMLMRA